MKYKLQNRGDGSSVSKSYCGNQSQKNCQTAAKVYRKVYQPFLQPTPSVLGFQSSLANSLILSATIPHYVGISDFSNFSCKSTNKYSADNTLYIKISDFSQFSCKFTNSVCYQHLICWDFRFF